MAAVDTSHFAAPSARANRVSVLQSALTGAVVLAVMFAVCWAAAALNFTASHMYVSLFTMAPVASATALVVGLGWSLVIGALTGALIAVTFDAFAFVARR